MSYDVDPYTPPNDLDSHEPVPHKTRERWGPLLYFAIAGVIAVFLAIPPLVPKSIAVKDDPNTPGYVLVLLSFPAGGLVYRIRSRKWPIDRSVRKRQITAICAILLLPIAAALLTGMRGQGLHITVLSGIVSLVFMASVLISGTRRCRKVA
jgi:peptidoglycan/LPS O-acetylase OafA/YrhL